MSRAQVVIYDGERTTYLYKSRYGEPSAFGDTLYYYLVEEANLSQDSANLTLDLFDTYDLTLTKGINKDIEYLYNVNLTEDHVIFSCVEHWGAPGDSIFSYNINRN